MRLLALSFLTVMIAFGYDVAGRWKATTQGPDGPVEVTFNFQVSEGKLTGSSNGPHGEVQITQGTVDGDKVNFTLENEHFKAILSGTVSGDDLKLTAQMGERAFDLAAKRVKP